MDAKNPSGHNLQRSYIGRYDLESLMYCKTAGYFTLNMKLNKFMHCMVALNTCKVHSLNIGNCFLIQTIHFQSPWYDI